MDDECLTFINTGVCPEQVSKVVDAYCNAPWDAIHAEGIHRDAALHLKHAPSLQTAALGYKLQLRHNLDRWNSLSVAERATAVAGFHAPHTLCLIKDRARKDTVHHRVKSSSFPQWLYRYGDLSHTDYKSFNKYVRSPKVLNAGKVQGDIQALQCDFFHKLFTNDDVVTFPNISMPAICDQLQGDMPPGPPGYHIWV